MSVYYKKLFRSLPNLYKVLCGNLIERKSNDYGRFTLSCKKNNTLLYFDLSTDEQKKNVMRFLKKLKKIDSCAKIEDFDYVVYSWISMDSIHYVLDMLF